MTTFLRLLTASLRATMATVLVCVVGYALAVLAVAQGLVPGTAEGSLITRADGTVIGSRLIGQPFTEPRYFWPRPSAVGYDASAAGGSNKSPTSPDLAERARTPVERHGATPERPLPADLAAASGGGLDPHVTEAAALYQVERVAAARPGLGRTRIEALVREHAVAPGGALTPGRVVNVLELNLALDAEGDQ
jgi:K+-transporting ATPase ATPase C chain